MSMSCWIIPASRIDARTLLLSDALLRLAGLLAVSLAVVASQLPLSALVLVTAAAGSAIGYRRLARRVGGRALHYADGAWCWLHDTGPGADVCREPLVAAALLGGRTVVTLELEGVRERYRLVVLLPLLNRECRRRILLAVRYSGERTVSTGSAARSG